MGQQSLPHGQVAAIHQRASFEDAHLAIGQVKMAHFPPFQQTQSLRRNHHQTMLLTQIRYQLQPLKEILICIQALPYPPLKAALILVASNSSRVEINCNSRSLNTLAVPFEWPLLLLSSLTGRQMDQTYLITVVVALLLTSSMIRTNTKATPAFPRTAMRVAHPQ